MTDYAATETEANGTTDNHTTEDKIGNSDPDGFAGCIWLDPNELVYPHQKDAWGGHDLWARDRDDKRVKEEIEYWQKRFTEAGRYDADHPLTGRILADGRTALLDGALRAMGGKRAHIRVPVRLIDVTDDDALMKSITLNWALGFSTKEKEKAVLMLLQPGSKWLKRTPAWLAHELHIDSKTVKEIAVRHDIQYADMVESRPDKKGRSKLFPSKIELAPEPTPEPQIKPDGQPRTHVSEINWEAIPNRQNWRPVTVQPQVNNATGKRNVRLSFEIDLRPVAAEIVAKDGKWRPTGDATFKITNGKLLVSVDADQIEPKVVPEPKSAPVKAPAVSPTPCEACNDTGVSTRWWEAWQSPFVPGTWGVNGDKHPRCNYCWRKATAIIVRPQPPTAIVNYEPADTWAPSPAASDTAQTTSVPAAPEPATADDVEREVFQQNVMVGKGTKVHAREAHDAKVTLCRIAFPPERGSRLGISIPTHTETPDTPVTCMDCLHRIAATLEYGKPVAERIVATDEQNIETVNVVTREEGVGMLELERPWHWRIARITRTNGQQIGKSEPIEQFATRREAVEALHRDDYLDEPAAAACLERAGSSETSAE